VEFAKNHGVVGNVKEAQDNHVHCYQPLLAQAFFVDKAIGKIEPQNHAANEPSFDCAKQSPITSENGNRSSGHSVA
jgi:hypothetical protein